MGGSTDLKGIPGQQWVSELNLYLKLKAETREVQSKTDKKTDKKTSDKINTEETQIITMPSASED